MRVQVGRGVVVELTAYSMMGSRSRLGVPYNHADTAQEDKTFPSRR